MKDQVDAAAKAAGPAEGPQTYSERRLLEIALASASIAFWVRLWSILSIIAVILLVIVNAQH